MTAAAQCTEEKYLPLKKKLTNINLEDIAKLDALEFAQTFKDEHRLLAALFHRKLESEGLFYPVEDDPFTAKPTITTLNLRGSVLSKEFSSFKNLEAVLTNISDSKLRVNAIDLRACQLLDTDVEDIISLVLRCNDAGSQSLVLALTGNRFSPEAIPTFIGICEMRTIKYVICPDVGHHGAKEQLAEAPAVFFEKFIFIRQVHLAGKGWYKIVRGDRRDAVAQTHSSFYKSEFGVKFA